jgi:hypothetical protein
MFLISGVNFKMKRKLKLMKVPEHMGYGRMHHARKLEGKSQIKVTRTCLLRIRALRNEK